MKWQIPTGRQSVIGVAEALDIVVGRLEHMQTPRSHGGQRLLAEAIQFATLVRAWAREQQPRVAPPQDPPGEYIGARPGGKPGPMSDG